MTSSEVNGIKPILEAMNSSLSTVELASNITQSMAKVGVSAMKTRLKLFATLESIMISTNYLSSATCNISSNTSNLYLQLEI